MFFKKIDVPLGKYALVLHSGRLHNILGAGKHRVFSPIGKTLSFHLEDASNLAVQWEGMERTLRFDRATAQRFWQIIDSPEGSNTLVYHAYLRPTVVPSGESHAFWKPDAHGDIRTCQLPTEAFRLPENVEKELLQRPKNTINKPLVRHTVQSNQKIMLTLNERLVDILSEGEYILQQSPNFNYIPLYVSCSPDQPVLETNSDGAIWQAQNPTLFGEHFEHIQAGENELIIWTVDGEPKGYLLPNQAAYFWKQPAAPYALLRINLADDLRIPDDLLAKLNRASKLFAGLIYHAAVPPEHQGLFYIDLKLQPEILPAGTYGFWNINRAPKVSPVDLRLQTSEISGQELLSADKVVLRVNAVCNWRVSDAVAWQSLHNTPEDFLYRELQFAIRAVIGGKNMDTLLADKNSTDAELLALMQEKRIAGIEIESVGIKDIILPGEIRAILNRVVEAEKSAQANNIRRREETAATRSLLNTARVMEENPTALRLKELETLEKVTEKIDKISVYGGLDGVLNGLINIRAPKE